MKTPLFLSIRQVEALHDESLRLYGGSQGLRSRVLFEAAAAYAFHLSQAQAFLDGSKRMAMAAALFFLKINGINTAVPAEDELYDAMIALAECRMGHTDLTEVFRRIFDS